MARADNAAKARAWLARAGNACNARQKNVGSRCGQLQLGANLRLKEHAPSDGARLQPPHKCDHGKGRKGSDRFAPRQTRGAGRAESTYLGSEEALLSVLRGQRESRKANPVPRGGKLIVLSLEWTQIYSFSKLA